MFESLAERLGAIFKRLRSRGKLTEEDVNEALREVRRALLEADVSLSVARDFVNRVRQKAVGEEVLKSLTPGQMVIKYVRDELIALLGQESPGLNLSSRPPTVIMMVGLHGAGKTTTCGKLSLYLKGKGHRPLLVATDVYRPAAVRQLEVLGQQIDVPVFQMGTDRDPVHITTEALRHAAAQGRDVVILDTAGRLHIDAELMDELRRQKEAVKPQEVLLVVDAMTGQDAVNIARDFTEAVDITGVVMTKLDGDARGGAALSVRAVCGRPIKFIGVGEKLQALEPFHPDRLVSRILGMGDVLTLIEKAEAAVDEEKAAEMEKKLREASFDLEDMLDTMRQMRKMGPLQDILGMIPGMGNALRGVQVDERALKRVEAVILSMTPRERRHPEILNASRKRRVARGSGTEVADVNRLLKQYEQMKKMMKGLTGAGRRGRGLLRLPPGFGL
ncbi:MAG TPA: signal recognition particle protein [Candidatus Nitrosotenuis sp.]|jgi:signal recognition particle subunit SRP54|nr:signal recognition particle protein [Candidatus Nitrosotenuis sp.]